MPEKIAGDHAQEPFSVSLAEERQRLTRTRIRRAAMEAVARDGFDATVDEIARLSGVSPRTIFRHYATHDRLILTAVRDIFAACGRRPIDCLPHPDDDLDGWLDGLALTIHTRNVDILGQAFWDVHSPRLDASETIGEIAVLRRDQRLRGVRYLVALAWRSAGGTGSPPHDLELAFALNFSAFTTHALMVDFDQTPEQIAATTADTLKLLLRRAVEVRSRGDIRVGVTVGDGAGRAPVAHHTR